MKLALLVIRSALVVLLTLMPALACNEVDEADRRTAAEWATVESFPLPQLPEVTPDFRSLELPDGPAVYVVPGVKAPLVHITLVAPVSRFEERFDERGAASTMLRAIRQDSMAFERLTALGGSLSVREHPYLIEFETQVFVGRWKQALRVLLNLVHRVALQDDAQRVVTEQVYSSFPSRVWEEVHFWPEVILARRLSGHPVAVAEEGRAVPAEALRAFAARTMCPARLVLGISGVVDIEEVTSIAREVPSDWHCKNDLRRATPKDARKEVTSVGPAAGFGFSEEEIIDADLEQAWIAAGRLVLGIARDDRVALELMQRITDIRLNLAARERMGLVNRAVLRLPLAGRGTGLLSVRAATRPQATRILIRTIRGVLSRVSSGAQDPAPEEIDLARRMAIAEWRVVVDTGPDLSRSLALEHSRYGGIEEFLDWERRVNDVIGAQVVRLAREYLQPSEMTVVIVGPQRLIEASTQAHWSEDYGF